MTNVVAVIIGRNEGERLGRCFTSVLPQIHHVIYVDSGSTDDSVSRAGAMGAKVVALDMSTPFTAARARNAGFEAATELNAEFVQFVDGDCELDATWCTHATEFLERNRKVAIAAGRLRERNVHDSIYNRLCDMEWDTPEGDVDQVGGIFMIRSEAFAATGGFNPEIIAGEEPDLCRRLAANGWGIVRLDHEMGSHDAEMHRFGQYWKRCVRSGHAYLEAVWRHRTTDFYPLLRPVMSILIWSLLLPIAVVLLCTFVHIAFLGVLLLYPIQWWRIYRGKKRLRGSADAKLYATFNLVGKLAHLQGLGLFLIRKLTRSRAKIIEYKEPNDSRHKVEMAHRSS